MTSQIFTQQDEYHPFDPHTARGLSEQEALKKLQTEGANELPASRRRTVFQMAFDIVREPMFLLLIAGGLIYLLLGDVREALVLLGSIFVIIGITFYQESKTERALEALRDLSSPRALVIRDGAQRRIAGREVVRDDLVMLGEGDRVPADGVVLWSVNLSIDESLLTGESVSVRKLPHTGAIPPLGKPGGDDLPFVFSGTLVVQGQGIAQIQATGMNTELGKIGKALQKSKTEETRLQHETGRMVRLLALEGGILCVLVVLRISARPLAQRPAGRYRPGYVGDAGRVPRRTHDLPGARCLAHRSQPGPHPPYARH